MRIKALSLLERVVITQVRVYSKKQGSVFLIDQSKICVFLINMILEGWTVKAGALKMVC